jgi:hypothetical protein
MQTSNLLRSQIKIQKSQLKMLKERIWKSKGEIPTLVDLKEDANQTMMRK